MPADAGKASAKKDSAQPSASHRLRLVRLSALDELGRWPADDHR
jgi:hypothetical protein